MREQQRFALRKLSELHVHQELQPRLNDMSESRTTAIAELTEPARVWTVSALQATGNTVSHGLDWAGDTAQKFGALVSALMGPAVVSVYALAVWSLASNLGWTDTFVFSTGPLSNWLVWLAIAILVNLASGILKRHTQSEK
jgi:hypothetical protein